jgi:uncharacterized membrane protein YwaF
MSDSTDFHTVEAPNGANSLPQKLPLMSAALAAVGAIVLIGSEIWLVAASTIWALHGLLAASLTVDIILGITILPIAVWATWKTVVLAIEAERNPENWL